MADGMADSATAEDGTSETERHDRTGRDPMDELRALLVGNERRQITELQSRIGDPEIRAKDVGAVLAEAIRLHGDDPELASALAPPLEDAITSSVRRNPQPLADALFPVMGPAIRKAIAHSLAAMVESLNQTLEHSFSLQSLKWRLTAFRTGKSFAEIVLLNTLVYRVEQIFLIDRASGLLLQHATATGVGADDADMVSGMLTAIRDFVRDSFNVDEHESLDALRVGELSVWIEQGPRAVLAAVIRGTAPQSLRATFQDALDTVHVQFASELESFRGDTATLEASRPILDSCLQAQFRTATQGKRRTTLLKAAVAIGLAALAVWAVFSALDRRRWNGYLEALRAEPGIVVVSSSRSGGRYSVSGLRDPLARHPSSFIQEAGLDPRLVTGHWELYQALDPPLVLARARALLRPPEGVSLTYSGGLLTASGAAPAAWIDRSQQVAAFLPGVTGMETAALSDTDLVALVQELQAQSLRFNKGSTEVVPEDGPRLSELVNLLGRLNDLARGRGLHYTVEVVGHTDLDGAPDANVPLSRARAERIAATLGRGLDGITVRPRGVGSDEPATTGSTEADKQRNRRVSLRIVPSSG
jgi:OOP family OmpA-OmpF porin